MLEIKSVKELQYKDGKLVAELIMSNDTPATLTGTTEPYPFFQQVANGLDEVSLDFKLRFSFDKQHEYHLETTPKEMTLQEIEEKLGYSISLID